MVRERTRDVPADKAITGTACKETSIQNGIRNGLGAIVDVVGSIGVALVLPLAVVGTIKSGANVMSDQ
jgi:hypothetical protein